MHVGGIHSVLLPHTQMHVASYRREQEVQPYVRSALRAAVRADSPNAGSTRPPFAMGKFELDLIACYTAAHYREEA